jgi:hypothetical protein
MTMALDPNAANHVQYIKKYDPNFQTLLDSLSDELNRKLEESGLTIIELFKKIAIRLDIKSFGLKCFEVSFLSHFYFHISTASLEMVFFQ